MDVGRAKTWLWLSILIAVLAISGSVISLALEERIYGSETANWAAQSVGQDVANLIAFSVLLVLAILALRGSLRAYLGWAGTLAYSVYTYSIYVFAVHFGPLFPLWVAVFGLSIYALIGGLASIDPARVREAFTNRAPVRITSAMLIGIGAGFSLLWLSEIVPAILTETRPQALEDSGLATNPVHVLDLAVFLPAAMAAGVLLSKRHAWGYVLAPVVLVAMVLLAIGIVTLMIVLTVRELDATTAVGAGIAVLAMVELATLIRYLQAIHGDVDLATVVRLSASRSDKQVGHGRGGDRSVVRVAEQSTAGNG